MIRKAYIYKINLVVEDDIDNLETQNKIDGLIENIIKELSEFKAEFISVQLDDFSSNENYGKCSNCGAWCSDWQKDNSIREFSDGAIVDNVWCCDLCLPKNHKNHF